MQRNKGHNDFMRQKPLHSNSIGHLDVEEVFASWVVVGIVYHEDEEVIILCRKRFSFYPETFCPLPTSSLSNYPVFIWELCHQGLIGGWGCKGTHEPRLRGFEGDRQLCRVGIKRHKNKHNRCELNRDHITVLLWKCRTCLHAVGIQKQGRERQ